MNKNKISFISFLFIHFSFSFLSAQIEYNLKSLNFINNTYKLKNKNDPINGIVFQLNDGKKMIMGKVVNGKKYGLWTELHPNNRRLQETYKNGLLDGFVSLFYPNGQKEWRHTYNNGILDGNYTKWHENGQMSMDGFFENGTPVGVWIWKDKYGNILKKETYRKKTKGLISNVKEYITKENIP